MPGKTLHIALTGGGSGGHIYPLLAVSEELRSFANIYGYNLDIRYFGYAGAFHDILIQNGIPASSVISGKMRRYFSLSNFTDAVKFPFALLQALWKMLLFMPEVIFSKGGSGALPIILAGRLYRIPIIIHESDAVPGRTNLASARFAARIAISFPEAAPYFTQRGIQNVALVGNPVRPSLLKNPYPQADAKRQLGFDSSLPLILVLGGSQGALRLNEFIVQCLPRLLEHCQAFHQTGMRHYSEVLEATKGFAARYKAVPYLESDLKAALSAADLVVARAGAGTIFEIAAFGKPAILVPLPAEIVGEHQIRNAYAFADAGAAVVVEEENLLQSIFLTQLKKIIDDPSLKDSMAEASRRFFRPDAAKKLAEEIIRLSRA